MSAPRCHFDYLNWTIGRTIAITRGPREGQQAKVREVFPVRDNWALDCIGEHGARFLVYPMDFAFVPQEAT